MKIKMKNAIKKWLGIKEGCIDADDVILTNDNGGGMMLTVWCEDVSDRLQHLEANASMFHDDIHILNNRINSLQSDLQLIMNYLGVKKEVIEATEAKKVLVPKDIDKLDVTKPLTKKKK